MKNMILSGHQPNYWPYPGLIGKIMLSDSFVYVTKVQFEKKSWQKRNRIRTKEGWTYLQVPTITKGKFDQNICDVEIDNTTPHELEAWFEVVRWLNPKQIMIYVIDRATPLQTINKVPSEKMNAIAQRLRQEGFNVIVSI